jgi:hypothetical protein
MKKPKKVKLKEVCVGDLVGYYPHEIQDIKIYGPMLGVVTRRWQKETLNINTGRWRYVLHVEIAWNHGPFSSVNQDEWEDGYVAPPVHPAWQFGAGFRLVSKAL